MLCAIQGEVAGADHDRESALEGVFLVRIARAGPRLELKVADVERGDRRSALLTSRAKRPSPIQNLPKSATSDEAMRLLVEAFSDPRSW
jgi:hypothetical protein